MPTWRTVALYVGFVTVVAGLSVAQLPLPNLSLDTPQVYTSSAVSIEVVGSGLSPSFRIVLDGEEIPTTFVAWNKLSANWPSGSVNGEYDVMVWNTYDHTVHSNHVSLILGHARRTAICVGGLLSQSVPVQAILDYEARYDTRNCRYLQTPRCFTGITSSHRCMP